MKVLWRSDAELNGLPDYAHIVDVGGDRVLEVMTKPLSFTKRLWVGIKFIFKGEPLVFSRVLLDEDIRKIGECLDK